MPGPGFAVIDFETTGVRPEMHDRIVEIAVVHLDSEGRFEAAFETLLNPGRDLGAQRIHGINARDIMDAPTFESIAADLLDHLDGRVLVAHNATFERRFLAAELRRIGVEPAVYPVLCTMQLAREFIPGGGRSLADCCAAFDIDLVGAHRASVDALATARLFGEYIAGGGSWQTMLADALSVGWPPVPRRRTRWTARPESDAVPQSFLARIVGRMPDVSGPVEHQEYLALLDRCLLDREISAHEEEALVALSNELGIGRASAQKLHDRYFDDLVAIAWADGVLTDEELDDLALVAALLQVDEERLAEATEPRVSAREPRRASRFELAPGDLVVLTGDMVRARADWHRELTQRGYVPHSAVTKKVKLVVAADPDSLSGKARKARDYDIVIVSEAGLAALLA